MAGEVSGAAANVAHALTNFLNPGEANKSNARSKTEKSYDTSVELERSKFKSALDQLKKLLDVDEQCTDVKEDKNRAKAIRDNGIILQKRLDELEFRVRHGGTYKTHFTSSPDADFEIEISEWFHGEKADKVGTFTIVNTYDSLSFSAGPSSARCLIASTFQEQYPAVQIQSCPSRTANFHQPFWLF